MHRLPPVCSFAFYINQMLSPNRTKNALCWKTSTDWWHIVRAFVGHPSLCYNQV